MEYLLAWCMTLAKDLLSREDMGLAEVAERVGYGSGSTFSTAFSRQVGQVRTKSRVPLATWYNRDTAAVNSRRALRDD